MSFAVGYFKRLVATVVSLIDSLGGPVRKLSNKRSSIPLWKKNDIVVSFNDENGIEVPKLARDFDIPKTTLTRTKTFGDPCVPNAFFETFWKHIFIDSSKYKMRKMHAYQTNHGIHWCRIGLFTKEGRVSLLATSTILTWYFCLCKLLNIFD